ncbi:peptidoglycan D,D-transpeptidase FtsI family protein [Cytobacillus purgationiresistens]|uniref:serine-type D-Ala-D-Ala carboxypeptidase n=1 Tax=Cytobacillus purgationiresistens TaxID=863449 RepID=A0ABU0AE67_9BACI|nr:penicillin-binding transpeptidase domain-containing protein [Cytobacillus purgationiresistens]MDQ0269547.1 cell division protein FtsI/penicillin-binding protein 2 [Cytobacillus purgationiresistens]
MWRKRAIIILAIFVSVLIVLMGRLVQLQLTDTEHFTTRNINLLEASVQQRSQEMVIDSGRGSFLDRNGNPLTEEYKPVLILFPFLSQMDWDIKSVSEITGASEYALRAAVETAKEPIAFGTPKPLELTDEQLKKINDLQIPGVFAVEKKYSLLNRPAEQLLGITSMDGKLKSRYPDKELPNEAMLGVTGMEKGFDEFLLPEGKSKLVYHVDAKGGPLFGINVKYVDPANPFYPVNIKTTLDYDLQRMAEKLMDEHKINKGGLVLMDIETNSVLAMVSRPSMNKDNPFADEGTTNLMVKQQIMGSIFKTVVAAAAVDYELTDPSRLFNCSQKINGQPDDKYDHGMQNFNNSFALSCNNTFGTLAKELMEIDPNILEDYAEKLSLIGSVGWKGDIYHFEDFIQIQDEDGGRVFLDDAASKDANFVAMTGIGQYEVRGTPLAITNMMATIARGGEKKMVRTASVVEYKNHTSLLQFKEKPLEGSHIKPYTAMSMQKLLREVVVNEKGTGRALSELPYEVAGKSGTGETGKEKDGEAIENKWFAGYFPYKNPKYALVTVRLDALEQSDPSTTALFADMVTQLYEYDQSREGN